MNDEQYNKLIERQLRKNEDAYFADIERNKDLVWNRIEERMEKKKVIPLWIYFAAASVFLLFSIEFFFNKKIKFKDGEIYRLNVQIESQKKQIAKIKEPSYNTDNKQITIIKEHEQIVYLQKQSIDTIVLHDTITNLVIKNDTVFVQENNLEEIADNEIIKENNLAENKVITTDKGLPKKNKSRRFIFLFGKLNNNAQELNASSNETQSLITLRSK